MVGVSIDFVRTRKDRFFQGIRTDAEMERYTAEYRLVSRERRYQPATPAPETTATSVRALCLKRTISG